MIGFVRTRRGHALMLAAAFLFSCARARAQENEGNFGFPESFPEFHGAASLNYSDVERQGSNSGRSLFDARGVYLRMTSKISRQIGTLIEFAWEETGDDASLSRVELQYMLHPLAALTFGKFPSPLGLQEIYSYMPFQKFPTVLLPFLYTNVFVKNWRESGVKVSGKWRARLDYLAWLSNGLRNSSSRLVADQNTDNNNNKIRGVGVGFSPLKEMSIGSGYATQKYDLANTLAIDFRTLDFSWKPFNGRLDIAGEFGRSRVEISTATYHRTSVYVQAGYKVFRHRRGIDYLEPAVRYETIDPDSRANNNSDQDRWTFGLNYSPVEHALFKLGYTITKERTGPDLNNNGVALEAVLDF